MEEYQPSRTADMDKILAIKELYCAVDHIEENILAEENKEKEKELKKLAINLTELRRMITRTMKGNKNYACLFKHLAGAARASEEVWLATHDDFDEDLFKAVNHAFLLTASKFLGRNITRCERCETEVEKEDTK